MQSLMYLYCIMCELMDEVYQGSHRQIIVHDEIGYHWLEWKECDGPFVYNAPVSVAIYMDYAIEDEPDTNELSIMNENASLLLADIEM